ncbi:MAG: flagellar motor switch protein FliG [Treponema sp.]|jgi:flagellar motor switch protein FliG|nr:flagellar motor switch protein FliG [Treponema sp.]
MPSPPADPTPNGQKESKYRRVAKFFVLVGAEEAARILPRLEPEQIEAVSREIAAIRGIGVEEGQEILDEFKSLLSSPQRFAGAFSGGPEAARRILYAAFGPEKGEGILNKTLPPSPESPFEFLEALTGEQVCLLLRNESPAVMALILSRLSPKLSAAVLAAIPPADRAELVRRIARQREVAPEVLEQAARTLREKAQSLGQSDTLEVDGMKALAAILRQGDYSFGDKILKNLEEQDAVLGQRLKDRLLTLKDVIDMDDKTLQEKLRTMTDRDIALLLKGKERDFSEKLLSNVSGERGQSIREEWDIMGPAARKDVDRATRNFLDWLWSLGPQVLQPQILKTTKDIGL